MIDSGNATATPPGDLSCFYQLIDHSPYGVYLVDSSFRLVRVSQGAQAVFKNVSPLLGRDFAEVVSTIWPEPFSTMVIGRFRHTLEIGEAYSSTQTTEQRRDLDIVESYDWKIERITLPDGDLAVVCYFYDITERQTAHDSANLLIRLSHELATVSSPDEIIQITTRMVGEHVGVHRCYFLEALPDGAHVVVHADWRQNGDDLAGTHALPSFGNEDWLRAVRRGPVVIDDVSRNSWTRDYVTGYNGVNVKAYTLAPFLKDGQWLAALGLSSDEPRHWKTEELTLVENVVARVWPLVQKARTTHELQKSEEKFRTLFESIDEGFCIVEVLFNGEGRGVDYRFQLANPAFTKLTGLENVIGKTALELVPDLEPFWAETYGNVALTGESIQFERLSARMERWFDVNAYPMGGREDRRVAIIFNNISERKEAEMAIAKVTAEAEKERRLYSTILSVMPDLVYVFDLQHRFTYANEALLSMWGKNWEESRLKTCLELGYEPWHAEMHDREIDQVVATKRPIRGEVPFSGTNGRRMYDYIFVPVIGDNGDVEAVAGTTRDVTDSRNAAEALRLQTAQFETLLNQAPLGVFVVDEALQVTHINPTAAPMFSGVERLNGCHLDEIAGFLWPSDTSGDLVTVVQNTLETGEPYLCAERPDVRNGLKEYFQWRIDRFTLSAGQHAVVCYFLDVTAQVQARKSITESEERFRQIVSVVADLLWVTDDKGFFSGEQEAWETFTGQSIKQSFGLGWMNAFHPEDRDEMLRGWLKACAEVSLFEGRGRIWHRSSQAWRHFTARAAPVLNGDGSVREWVGACSDVDVQKRIEEALRVARDNAERASEAKDRFLAVLSHELRTPLTPVLMTLAGMQHEDRFPSEMKEDLAMMRRNIELETKLIDDLLDLSRITSGKLTLNVESVDLHEILQRVLVICRPQARDREVKLSFSPTKTALYVHGDAARLQQIFWNIVRNAIKFSDAGAEVHLSTSFKPEGKCEVMVRDSGIGIPEEALPRIFKAFEQAGMDITRQFGGLGLGLAICDALVGLHGGTIKAESEGRGKGAVFTIGLPCAPAMVKNGVHPDQHDSPPNGDHKRLLVVDDHGDTLRTLSKVLGRSGYDVTTASSVGEALKAVASHPIDLLISDLGLPDGDGYQLMRSVSEDHLIPGIAMSGFGMEEDVRKSLTAGFSAHLVKPVDVAQLFKTISRVLNGGERQRD